MKRRFVTNASHGEVQSFFDANKVSMAYRIDDLSFRMIIDGNCETLTWENKEDCDREFKFLYDFITKSTE